MAWSTRQLAELSGTTVNTVRHYHHVGVLEVPERGLNGYKSYGVPHLVRLLQIKRLRDLGVSLSRIADLGQSGEDQHEEIEVLGAELDATIARLIRVRAELSEAGLYRARVDTPRGFAPVVEHLSEAQRSMLRVYSTTFSEAALDELRRALAVREDVDQEFESLPADADEATIDQLAERMAVVARRVRAGFPELVDPWAQSGSEAAAVAMAEAMVQFYNPAQLQVVQRLGSFDATQGDDPVEPS